MKITKHTVPSVTYTLTVDGQELEQTGVDNPLVFLSGVGQMIPGFESQLEGLQKGDSYDITVTAAEGYGEINPEAVVDIPKTVFMVEGKLQEDLLFEGNVIPLQDQNGSPLQGTVKSIAEETVKVDFNHGLAGKTLSFKGEVVDVRAASEEEIEHGHVHGPGGHEH